MSGGTSALACPAPDGRDAELAALRAAVATLRASQARLESIVETQQAALAGPQATLAARRRTVRGCDQAPASRRQLLKRLGGAAATVATAAALQSATDPPAHAADGGNLVIGQLNTAGSTTTLQKSGVANSGEAFRVNGGDGLNPVSGVVGVAGSASLNVFASDIAALKGLTFGYDAVLGVASASSGLGVIGVSQENTGVFGLSYAFASSSSAKTANPNAGVTGYGTDNCGVIGQTDAHPGTLVSGGLRAAGVLGRSRFKNAGVYGYDEGEPSRLPSYGVVGQSQSAFGVFGYSSAPTGTLVNSPSGIPPGTIGVAGVFGSAPGNTGVYGISGSGIGVVGQSQNIGLLGGLLGGAGPGALAGLFLGNVQIQGSLTVTGSYPKSAAIPHPDGSHRRLYCVEAPEPYLEDFGEGHIESGRVTVALDSDFTALVQSDRYHVFVTPHDDVHLHVRNRTARGFDVRLTTGSAGREAGSPAGAAAPERATVAFSWRVVARRKDIAGPRLERVEVVSPPVPRPQGVPTLPPAHLPSEAPRAGARPDRP